MKYHPDSDWDFQLVGGHLPIDLNLILPHYRARNQPVEHRMSMFVATDSAPIKLKVVSRPTTPKKVKIVSLTIDSVVLFLPTFTWKFWRRRQTLLSGSPQTSKAKFITLAKQHSPLVSSTEYYATFV